MQESLHFFNVPLETLRVIILRQGLDVVMGRHRANPNLVRGDGETCRYALGRPA